MKKNPGKWLKNFILLMAALLAVTGILTAVVDPFFHYHAPLPGLSYELSQQRFQNDGITRHFSYNAVITGTSMTENFKTSEFDALFGTHSIKVPYPGATYREISDNLDAAFATHDDITIVLRCLDYTQLVKDPDALRTDMGEYPEYLYDSNPFNDVQYLFNLDAMFEYTIPTLIRCLRGEPGGVTSFDDYSWTGEDTYSRDKVLPTLLAYQGMAKQEDLTDKERQLVTDNITENVLSQALANPDTEFIIFFPPYSIAWWSDLAGEGTLKKQIQAEELAEELLLTAPNIHLYSFNLEDDIICDLDNYKDEGHYSPAVSSMLLQRIHDGKDEITKENVASYAKAQEEKFMNFDYAGFAGKESGDS